MCGCQNKEAKRILPLRFSVLSFDCESIASLALVRVPVVHHQLGAGELHLPAGGQPVRHYAPLGRLVCLKHCWFTELQNKKKLSFIQFDVVNFYASITPALLESSLTFATSFINISNDTKATIRQASNSFLCKDNETWIKQESEMFDISRQLEQPRVFFNKPLILVCFALCKNWDKILK